MVAPLVLLGCGETRREFSTDNALGLDASLDTSLDTSAARSDSDSPTADTRGSAPSSDEPDNTTRRADSDDAVPPRDSSEPAATSTNEADAAPLPMSSCTSTDYDALSIIDPTDFAGVRDIYFFGDAITTACVTHTEGRVCIEGNVPLASDGTNPYANWGVGLGMYVAVGEGPFDAAARGVDAVRFAVTEVTGRALRVAITQLPDPTISDDALNYQNNAFVLGGSQVRDVASDSVVTARLEDFGLPPWTRFIDPETGEPAVGKPLDVSQIASLQVQLVNDVDDPPRMFTYCVSDVAWLDVDGNPVDVSAPSSAESAAE